MDEKEFDILIRDTRTELTKIVSESKQPLTLSTIVEDLSVNEYEERLITKGVIITISNESLLRRHVKALDELNKT